MKTAVVFYSLDGDCALVAREIKKQVNADLLWLHLKSEKKRTFVGKLFWGGCMSLSKKNPPLAPYEFDPSGYDLIVFGAPVWAGSPCPAIRTFLCEQEIKGKKIALYMCHLGGMGNAMEKFKSMFDGNEIVRVKDFEALIKNYGDEAKQKITDFAKSLAL